MRGGRNRMDCPDRPCSLCGGPMTRGRYPCGFLEKPKNFAKRKFCGTDCYAIHRRREARSEARLLRRLKLEYVAA